MKAVTYFELDISYCQLNYGQAPCQAQLGTTGDSKCFNSLSTCQDLPRFTRDNTVTLRFTTDGIDQSESGIPAIPCMVSHNLNPGTISLGEDLGTRTTLNVSFRDIPYSDTGEGFDKYWRERGYDPYRVGSFWGKFRARQPYLRGNSARLIRGYHGQSLEEMETRHYIVESFDGPTVNGTFSISCRDILKMLDGDRAQAPVASPGYLLSDLTPTATSATLGPANIGNEFYPTSGLMAIGGKEIVSFTRSGNSLTLTRGREGTVAQELKAQDRCQVVLKYTAQDAADIIRSLMVNYAGVPAEYIPLSEWKQETANNLQAVYTRTIAEPTSVAILVAELIRSAALMVWWDEVQKKVQLRVLKPIVEARTLDETQYLENSLSYQDQPNKRMTEIWTYFGVRNPLRPLSDPDNYLSVEKRINARALSLYAEDAIEKRFAPWIPQLARQTADRLNILTLGRFENPPRLITGSLFRGTAPVELGEGVNIEDRFVQNPSGFIAPLPAQVVSLDPREDRTIFRAEEARWTVLEEIDLSDRLISIDVNMFNANLRSIHDQIYPPLRAGDKVTFIISSSVSIGSSRSGSSALNVGSWPAGFVPEIRLAGRLRGAGGNGGRGATGRGGNGYAGASGGTALYTRHPVRLVYLAGAQIWGGGGGGGGGGATLDQRGSGGGGGAGRNPGAGGASGGSFGKAGAAGTETAGGLAGAGTDGGRGPNNRRQGGGNGGGPGAAGQKGGSGGNRGQGGAGGAAGRSIDGNSYVTVVSGSVDRRGPVAN